MTQVLRQVLETLWDDGNFVLSRWIVTGNQSPVLALAPSAERPAPWIIARLEHTYTLRERLDPGSVPRLMTFMQEGDLRALLFEDRGCNLLAHLIGQPWEVTQFLQVAAGIAAALGGLHAEGLIHGSVTPANILVDLSRGRAWLLGASFESRLPETQSLTPQQTAGTLAYMAPEQTGRVNRAVDARSDLYSLGITLYEMLTGTLPFSAADPMEWAHAHIARQPMPPSERFAEIPEQLSNVVLKLLSKTPESRYQSAAGLEADLRACHVSWEVHRRIDAFPLAAKDNAQRLLIPDRLYGRDQEVRELQAAFDRVVDVGRPELVLVSGYSGIGKSSVVSEVCKQLVSRQAIFASGKFDQYKRHIPYATLAQALQSIIYQILSKSDTEVAAWKRVLQEAVGPNGQLIVNLIPELEFIIGTQPPASYLAPQESQARFQLLFQRFLGAFALPEHPLVLFLDDLQWVDDATLELVEHLVVDAEIHHVLLIGAYRDNEVDLSHPLRRVLAIARHSDANVREIALSPLALPDVTKLVADSLHSSLESAEPVAELVYEKTGGNPFFLIQFFAALAEEGLLRFNPASSAWIWDISRIRGKEYTDNLAEFMAAKLHRLPPRTQEALGQFACLGNTAELVILVRIREETEEELHVSLEEATRVGLVIRTDKGYTFLHDRVHEAAYALIPENDRAAVHLRIGRLMASQIGRGEAGEEIFEIVNQLNRGSSLVESADEREWIAELNLIAGKRAKAATAYASALAYLTAGRALLDDHSWQRRYSLVFGLEFERAECEFLAGHFSVAEERLLMLGQKAGGLIDRAAIVRLQIDLYASLDLSHRAVESGLEYLRNVGVDWSPHPTDDEVQQEYDRIWSELGNRPIESLVDLPAMTSATCRATLDVLTALEEPAYFTDQNLRCLIVARMVNLSLENGNSDGSCVAYVQLGWFVGPRFGDYQAAFRFGKLGLDLVEKHGLERFRARVSQNFGYFINPWSRHLRSSVELLRDSFVKAQQAGDLKYAVYGCDRLTTVLLAAGAPLVEVQAQAERAIEFARRAKFGYVVDIIVGQLRFIRTLRGLTPSLASFNDAEFNEALFEERMEANPHSMFAICWYWIRKLRARFYAGDYLSALAAAAKAKPLLLPGVQHFEVAEYLFYAALTHAAVYDSVSPEDKIQQRKALAAAHRQILILAENCPENFGTCAALVGAELGRIEGREFDAEHLYEEAIESARANNFIQNEAIAHETAAHFYARRGLQTVARAYLQSARDLYFHWGALGKVKQLEQNFPGIRESHRFSGPSLEHVDVQALASASQAVSSELDLPKLVETLLAIALKDAGAQRGILLLVRDQEAQIEAEAITGPDSVIVNFRQAPPTPMELPDSLLRYVIRTQESIILDDASAPNQFSPDEYIRKKQARSVLCFPLIKQAILMGVLYLENNLASHVFTPQRISVLKVLVSQASISLDHARLVAELTKEIAERKRAEEELRESEASLREAQTELAHITRVTTMGELAASIAHEVNQPLAGIVTNGNASLRWLAGPSPNLDEAREAIRRIIRDGSRAGQVVARIRALSQKTRAARESLDINEAIGEIVVLISGELQRNQVGLHLDLAVDLPLVVGDRVQLQQVVMNLILNGVEAMRTIAEHDRNLTIRTERGEGDEVRVAFQDSGIGLDPKTQEQIFDAFYTTKPGGLGMGLAISRSIVENHGGRLWAMPNQGPGSTFCFTLRK
ncbi:MAG: AAA family ATPase [Verrucomicrobia bacterium]|nr:AAA family ATPase [Verrucomicrobiota bacterium]